MSRAFFRRRSQAEPSPEVKPGDSYCRHHGDRVTETATVLNLCSDLLGIPHVRFNVAFDRTDAGRFEGGLRILALESALGRLAHVTPREGTWKDSYLALQMHARKLLDRRESESRRTT